MSSWVEKLVRKALENRFRAKVLEEAIQQRKLSDAGEPIPSHLRVQARLSGLLIAGASTAGGFALTGLSLVSGWVYVCFIFTTVKFGNLTILFHFHSGKVLVI